MKLPSASILSETDPATRLTDGVTTWDVGQLHDAVAQWVRALDDLAVVVVAFDLPNGLEWAALDIALLESGRVAVPLPSFFSAEQRKHALEDSGAELLIFADEFPEGGQPDTRVRNTSVRRLVCGQSPVLPPGTAVVSYTSGSTGAPKGICLSADTLLQTARSVVHALQGENVRKHLCILPLTLLLENTAGLFANLLNGSEIHVPNLSSLGIHGSSDVSFAEFVQGIGWHAPDSIIVVPALLLGMTAAAEFGVAEFSSLKFVAVGGGRVSPELLERAATQNLPVFEGYGLTECGSVVALNTPDYSRAGSVGRLLPHVQAHVEKGELIVAAPTMLGILGEPDTVHGCVATGDRVEIDADGFLTVHGRIKNTFITAYGRNVSPEWVESELQTELVIAHAIVFGEAATINTALLVPRGEVTDNDIENALARCNQRLPDYAQVQRWHRISLQELDEAGGLTGNGRIKRAVVAAAFTDLISRSH